MSEQTETDNTTKLETKGMRERLESVLEEFGVKDAATKKEAIIKTASDFANTGKAEYLMEKAVSRAVRKGITELSIKERIILAVPGVVVTLIGFVGGLLLVGVLGGPETNAEAGGVAAPPQGTSENPFASVEPLKATARPLKSASN